MRYVFGPLSEAKAVLGLPAGADNDLLVTEGMKFLNANAKGVTLTRCHEGYIWIRWRMPGVLGTVLGMTDGPTAPSPEDAVFNGLPKAVARAVIRLATQRGLVPRDSSH